MPSATALAGSTLQLSAPFKTQALPPQYWACSASASAAFWEPNAFDTRSRPLRNTVEPSAWPSELTPSASTARSTSVCGAVSLSVKVNDGAGANATPALKRLAATTAPLKVPVPSKGAALSVTGWAKFGVVAALAS